MKKTADFLCRQRRWQSFGAAKLDPTRPSLRRFSSVHWRNLGLPAAGFDHQKNNQRLYALNKEKIKANRKSYYRLNWTKCRDSANQTQKEAVARNRAFVDTLKTSTPCADCGNFYPPVCMDYDHLPGFRKAYGVANMVGQGRALPEIQREIDKCQLVCSNCHRIRTASRKKICQTT